MYLATRFIGQSAEILTTRAHYHKARVLWANPKMRRIAVEFYGRSRGQLTRMVDSIPFRDVQQIRFYVNGKKET